MSWLEQLRPEGHGLSARERDQQAHVLGRYADAMFAAACRKLDLDLAQAAKAPITALTAAEARLTAPWRAGEVPL